MKRYTFILAIIILLVTTGCDTDERTPAAVPSPSSYSAVAEADYITANGPDTYDAQVTEYDLGTEVYTDTSGVSNTINLRGVIGVPAGKGSFPLVLIIPGSQTETADTKRLDTGLTYLVEKLANNGYIAVSMDMSSAYTDEYNESSRKEAALFIAQKQMLLLQEANDGNSPLFIPQLSGKVDFSKTGLCGTSEGCDSIFDLAQNQEDIGWTISSLLAITPEKEAESEKKHWTNTTVSFLIPEYDGITPSLDGLSLDAIIQANTDAPHSVSMLKKANHNYFNANITENDALDVLPEELLKEQLSPKEQQLFLSHYAVDFFDASLKGKTEGTIYAANAVAPQKMYGYDVMCRLGREDDLSLININGSKDWNLNGCTAADTLKPGDQQAQKLLKISWEQIGADFSFEPLQTDFRNHNVLSLRMAPDSTDPLNEGLKGQSLTVILTDDSGSTSAITLPGCPNSLTLASSQDLSTPIMSTDIRLSEFKGVTLDSITSVALYFDQSDSGSVLLEDIVLQ